MVSAITPSSVRTGNALTSATATGDTKAPSFTRPTPSELSQPISRPEASKIKDKGGIDPAASLYGQIQSIAQSVLASGRFNNGARVAGRMDIGPNYGYTIGTHVVDARGVGNEVHTNIYEHGALTHDVRFIPSGNGGAHVTMNGQVLTPNSSLNDLHLVRAITFKY